MSFENDESIENESSNSESSENEDSNDNSGPEVYEGVTLCQKHVIIIRNHGKHDVETIKLMLADLKSPDEAKRRSAPRTLWITGYGGEGSWNEDRSTWIAAGRQWGEDPRTQMLMKHMENRCGGIRLYIADDEDSNKLYDCGMYMFTGDMRCGKGGDEESDVNELAKRLDLAEQEHIDMCMTRSFAHFRFYLGPEPPSHPDSWRSFGGEDPRLRIGTIEMNYDTNEIHDLEAL